MLNTDSLIRQVRRNCDISDARHAGLYSICGLALRLRDLFKWEHGLQPWEERAAGEVLSWIGDKESAWEDLAEHEFSDINVNGRTFDPFDVTGINAALASGNLFYGAGYAFSLKPTFFLANLQKKNRLNGLTVYILERELARDLLTIPAMSQSGCIVFRSESARYFSWDQMTYVTKSGRFALEFALNEMGINDFGSRSRQRHFDRILGVQQGIYIRHEAGELTDRVFDPSLWREIIAAFPHTPVELLARTVKDLLADCGGEGPLRYIVNVKDAAALGLYMAFFGGLAKSMFSELPEAFNRFVADRDWRGIYSIVRASHKRAVDYAERLTNLFNRGKATGELDAARHQIEATFLPATGSNADATNRD